MKIGSLLGIHQLLELVLKLEKRMLNAGYFEIGSAPGQGGRIKVWWSHNEYPRVESIYSPDKNIVLTADLISLK